MSFINNTVINIQQSRFLADLMWVWYYNINKANLPTKWTVCLPNPVINHHLDRIIIINLTSTMSERRAACDRRARSLPYIMWRLLVSNKHYAGPTVSCSQCRGPISISFFFGNKYIYDCIHLPMITPTYILQYNLYQTCVLTLKLINKKCKWNFYWHLNQTINQIAKCNKSWKNLLPEWQSCDKQRDVW